MGRGRPKAELVLEASEQAQLAADFDCPLALGSSGIGAARPYRVGLRSRGVQ